MLAQMQRACSTLLAASCSGGAHRLCLCWDAVVDAEVCPLRAQMDEEELYSAVARTQGTDASSEPGRDTDAANSDTFGAAAAETSGSEAGGMAREGSAASLASKSGSGGPAWASAGAGVAAVAGGGGRCSIQTACV